MYLRTMSSRSQSTRDRSNLTLLRADAALKSGRATTRSDATKKTCNRKLSTRAFDRYPIQYLNFEISEPYQEVVLLRNFIRQLTMIGDDNGGAQC